MITVVVPTFNRAADLDRCLRALQTQTLAGPLFEVVVIDDGSQDTTPELLSRRAAEWSRLRFHRQDNAGPAAARNLGIANARGSVIAFTDDDCQPAPDWLDRIHSRFGQGLQGCLHGAVRSTLPSGPFVHSVVADGAVITSNIAVEKSVFDQTGVFDPDFRAPWCEDADFYYRLTKAGIPITYDPLLTVDHPPRYQAYWSFLRKSRFFQYYGLIARKHPEMEPLSQHSDRLILAARKLVFILAAATALRLLTELPWSVCILLSPLAFCFVDGIRVTRMAHSLAQRGIEVRTKDRVLYTLLNWTATLAESYYLLKGAIVYGYGSGRS